MSGTSTDKLARLKQVEAMAMLAKTIWVNDLSYSMQYSLPSLLASIMAPCMMK